MDWWGEPRGRGTATDCVEDGSGGGATASADPLCTAVVVVVVAAAVDGTVTTGVATIDSTAVSPAAAPSLPARADRNNGAGAVARSPLASVCEVGIDGDLMADSGGDGGDGSTKSNPCDSTLPPGADAPGASGALTAIGVGAPHGSAAPVGTVGVAVADR